MKTISRWWKLSLFSPLGLSLWMIQPTALLNAADPSEKAADGEATATVVVDISGDRSEVVRSAIEKLEKQLKASGLPVELQQKALDSLRGQLDQSGDGSASPKQTQQRLEFRYPLPMSNKMNAGRAGEIAQAFAFSHSFGPAQKKKLKDAVSEALEESGVEAEVIEKALDRMEKKLDEFGGHSNYSWRSNQQPPFRLGIGCKAKEAGDSTPGLEVETVFEDAPAAIAGLKPGDRLIEIDDQPIATHDDIVAAVQKAGQENRSVRVQATRDGESQSFEIKPHQSAVAELNAESMQPFITPSIPFPGQAWVMQQVPKSGMAPAFDSKFQEQVRDELSKVQKQLEEMKDMLKEMKKNR